MDAIGTYGKSCSKLKSILNDLMDEKEVNYVMSKMANVCIRCTYYLFCVRNKAKITKSRKFLPLK